MAYEHKPGDFALFKNDKGDNDKRPDYRGEGMDLEGNPIEVAAWIREGKKGKFMSCKMKPHANAQPKPQARKPVDDDPDSIPF